MDLRECIALVIEVRADYLAARPARALARAARRYVVDPAQAPLLALRLLRVAVRAQRLQVAYVICTAGRARPHGHLRLMDYQTTLKTCVITDLREGRFII